MNKKVFVIFWFTAIALLAGCAQQSARELPVLGNKQITEQVIDGKTVYDTAYHTIPDFKFVNQDSSWVTQDTFDGKIYVADFFFTSCPTICPTMKTQMLRIYKAFENQNDVSLLSHSIDPTHDSVAVLKSFADRLGVSSSKWHFVTGNKKAIYDIGQKSYLVSAQEDEEAAGGFIHSGAFILIDKQKRIRGYYDGTEEKEVDRLIKDIKLLLSQYKKEDNV